MISKSTRRLTFGYVESSFVPMANADPKANASPIYLQSAQCQSRGIPFEKNYRSKQIRRGLVRLVSGHSGLPSRLGTSTYLKYSRGHTCLQSLRPNGRYRQVYSTKCFSCLKPGRFVTMSFERVSVCASTRRWDRSRTRARRGGGGKRTTKEVSSFVRESPPSRQEIVMRSRKGKKQGIKNNRSLTLSSLRGLSEMLLGGYFDEAYTSKFWWSKRFRHF